LATKKGDKKKTPKNFFLKSETVKLMGEQYEREKYDGHENELVIFLSRDTKNGGIKQGSV
jgi:hypothetical protein